MEIILQNGPAPSHRHAYMYFLMCTATRLLALSFGAW